MNILYLGGAAPFGGASRSLYEAVGALDDGAVEAFFFMPRGTALDFYRRVAADTYAVRGVSRFDHTRATHYRSVRWLVVLRELFYAPFTLFGLMAARNRWPKIRIVHVNEITEIIPGIIAKRMFGAKLVIHVRSLVETDVRLRRTRWLHRLLRRHADAIISIDESVRATIPADLHVDVIHNSFTARPIEQSDSAYLAKLEQLQPASLKVGFVGNLLRIKGLSELVRAIRIARDDGADVQLMVIGGSLAKASGVKARILQLIGVAQNAEEDSHALVKELALENDVFFFGPTPDIQRVYPIMDVLAFPSHFDAPGRPVFEAAFFCVPSIVAVSEPRPDTIVDGETGIAVRAPDPHLIAAAILHFARNRDELARMGSNAKRLAEETFLPKVNSALLLALYNRLVS